MCALPLEHEIEYPTSDGQPMAETTLHRVVMTDLIQGLERRYAEVPDVWAGGNLFLCYREGDPRAHVAPDVLLAFGVDKRPRDNYLLWEERPPVLIFEITSRSTRREDTGHKRHLYEQLGVAELVLFDPYGEYLTPRLQGFRLAEGRYRPIAPQEDGALELETTALALHPEGERLRMVDADTGEPLPWSDELGQALARAQEHAAAETAARQAAEERATQEAAARRAAEARAAEAEERLRALAEEITRLRP
jgi:Uma2 family endonuclease